MNIKNIYYNFVEFTNSMQSFILLLVRLVIAYGFYKPAITKWNDMGSVVGWFSFLGVPFSDINAYVVASIEISGVVLLTLGLFTRFISIPLIFVMIGAIFIVHLENGFSAVINGYEVPMYYIIFLLVLLSNGAGKFSLDRLFFKKDN
jgi:putative oxidoreductase